MPDQPEPPTVWEEFRQNRRLIGVAWLLFTLLMPLVDYVRIAIASRISGRPLFYSLTTELIAAPFLAAWYVAGLLFAVAMMLAVFWGRTI